MRVLFVSRHQGAQRWMLQQPVKVNMWLEHLDLAQVQADDWVVGTLPANLAAEVCAKGARYWHLSLWVPEHLRGLELTEAQMRECDAKVQEYTVQAVASVFSLGG